MALVFRTGSDNGPSSNFQGKEKKKRRTKKALKNLYVELTLQRTAMSLGLTISYF